MLERYYHALHAKNNDQGIENRTDTQRKNQYQY